MMPGLALYLLIIPALLWGLFGEVLEKKLTAYYRRKTEQ